jgi:hypothetical protein
MLDVLALGCVVAFLVLPWVMLWCMPAKASRSLWWLGGLAVVVGEWALVVVAAAARETPDTGAAKVIALLFGWIYGAIWLCLCWAAYAAVRLAFRLLRRVNGGPASEPSSPSP